jgi:hypothetical protein
MQEYELYQPIKSLLELQGFTVKGEVIDMDIFAMKEDYLIAVELKTNITLKIIYQAIERQKICNKVYIGLPIEAVKSHKSSYKSFILLLKRLDIGLITVKNNEALIMLESFGFDLEKSRDKNKRKKTQAVLEFSLRENKINVGGIRGKKITHYKEQVIKIAQVLRGLTEATPKQLREKTNISKTSDILQKNYYLWFHRKSKGIYQLSEIGKFELSKCEEKMNEYQRG